MRQITKPEQLHVGTWHQCDSWLVYADYFATPALCTVYPTDRKFRLLVVAALQAVWQYITDPRSRAAIVAAELYADDPSLLPREDVIQAALEAADEAEDGERLGGYESDGVTSLVASLAWLAAGPQPRATAL